MIVDKLENIDKYAALNPLFARVVDYLKTADLHTAKPGTEVKLVADDLFVKFEQTQPKSKEQALLEAHRKYIDIHIPLSGTELMGYTPVADLPEMPYEAKTDIAFFEAGAACYLEVKQGMFAVFFPQDAHAPAISETGLYKVIIKVLA